MKVKTKSLLIIVLVLIFAIPAVILILPKPQPIHIRLETEDAKLLGVEKASARPGYSGTGYVQSFDNDGDNLELKFKIIPGLYEIRLTYASPFGNKDYDLQVNSEKDSGTFIGTQDAFATHTSGKYLLSAEENTITIGKGWGWFEIDCIDLYPAVAVSPSKPKVRPADPQADTSAKKLLSYLDKISGKKTLSGQHGFEEIAHIQKITGKEPAVGGFDLMEYSPSRLEQGADPKQLTEQIIKWAGTRGIVTLCWHWNAPANLIDEEGKKWWRGFNTDATTFDLEKALSKPDSPEYQLLLRDLDAIAAELKKFHDAGVPILWRPLHEPQGKWFWWGNSGTESFVKLWRLMFDRFTKKHKLHNLLWVYSPVGDFSDQAWYPGDDFVDIIGVDIYTDSPANMNRQWEALQKFYGNRKLIALAECETPPDPEIMEKYQISWLWYSPWFGNAIYKMPEKDIQSIYKNKNTITRGQLPAI